MEGPGQVRIIAGTHRGRQIHFPSIEGLRPTPNRIRETLFNWLQDEIQGMSCVDLFAGSGALGFEALSRGAKQVSFVEKDAKIAQSLRDNLQRFAWQDRGTVFCQDASQWLKENASVQGYFLDPSFLHSHPNEFLLMIEALGHLKTAQWIYCERGRDSAGLNIPHAWQAFREKQAGSVCYALLKPERQG